MGSSTDQCQEGRQEMLTKADQLLCTISRRREKVSLMIIMASIKITSITSMDGNDMQVASVLEGSASKSDWAAIRRCLLVMIITTMEIWMEMMMT